jgi:hypothetical protein
LNRAQPHLDERSRSTETGVHLQRNAQSPLYTKGSRHGAKRLAAVSAKNHVAGDERLQGRR